MTLELVENSPRFNLSYAWTQGRLSVRSWGLQYCATSPKAVMSLLPPFGFLTRKEVFKYSTWTLTCSGLAKMPADSSSSNLSCSSFSVLRLYWGSLPFRCGGRVGPMLTKASIFPLAPLYLETAGLKTSSYSKWRE